MIKVERIHIQEFRGIRDLTLEFGGNSYAICGPNGTGKSGVVDAIEFALTGNISRLSGEGRGNVSVKEHAPHVDSRDNPEKAKVTITFKTALEGKEVVLERTVKNASLPKVTPSNPEISEVLKQFNGHSEFVLSRREIINYVIAQPGDRSAEVQALLRLDQVGELRSSLKTISNTYEKEAKTSEKIAREMAESLAQSLEITELVKENILEAVNSRRAILGLAPLVELAATTAFSDGLETGAKPKASSKVDKVTAKTDLKSWVDLSGKITGPGVKSQCSGLKDELVALSANPIVNEGISRESFLRKAVDFITDATCPVCDTDWGDISKLKAIVGGKLQKFDEVVKLRKDIESRLEPVIVLLEDFDGVLASLEGVGKTLAIDNLEVLSDYRKSLAIRIKSLRNFLPVKDAVDALGDIESIPDDLIKVVQDIERAVADIPEPTRQEAARDFIIRAQDRLEARRKVARDASKARKRADLVKKIYEVYAKVSDSALEGVYKDVESDFSNFYRAINSEDENDFSAKLIPSIGRLGFDVDFYGRGHFPPGAYHSEGHQDAMGLCLYLALMRKLQGSNFKFAVLDDVLMSVDTAHRREVCKLLKQQFTGTQFVLTTHDEIWLKMMKTVGLIKPKDAIQFSNWTPDIGPTEWKNRDIWTEIDQALKANDVNAAAGKLRYYLEHVFREICDALRVRVEFRGDGRYELGDTLAPAVKHFRKLLLDGAKAATSWGKTTEASDLKAREKAVGESLTDSNAEQWLINPAVHYNEWANFSVNDFTPVVSAFRGLVGKFFCENPQCGNLFYLTAQTGSPKTPDSVKCGCGQTNINLKEK